MNKKIIILALLTGLFSTGCININNSAVQKLNDKAAEYLQNGNPQRAIYMLEASSELEPNLYETRYNLGIIYIDLKDYKNAIDNLNLALKIKDSANAYYSLALAYEEMGFSMLEKEDEENADNKNISEDDISGAVEDLNLAIVSYKKYLEKDKNSNDRERIEEQIATIENKINELNSGKINDNTQPF